MTDGGSHPWGEPNLPAPPIPARAADAGAPPGVPLPPRPGPPGARPAPRRKPRIWPWLLGALLVMLLGIAGCTAFVFSIARGPIDAANTFVALVDDGELDAAYASLCGETREGLTIEEFRQDMSRAADITGYTLTSVSAATGRPTLVSGTIELDDSPRNVAFQMRQINDQWQVCSYDRLN